MAKFLKELKFARETAYDAGQLLHRQFYRKHRVQLKGRVDLVTEADLKSERYIKRQIEKNFPSHSILAEEAGLTEKHHEYNWIIDPLDGTTNYAHGYPAYCVSIGLEVEKKLVVGAIYNPVLDEMFYARTGEGAYLGRKRIRVSKERKLSASLLATGFPYDIAETRIDNLGNFARMYKQARAVRRAGSAALDLCYLACGRFDGFWELKLHPWDTAAAVVIVREAGGRITSIDGNKYSIYGKDILATNGKIHNQMQKVLIKYHHKH